MVPVGRMVVLRSTAKSDLINAFPLAEVWAMRIKSYTVTITGGTLFRIAIGAVPFLLPLMSQIGFGLNAFDAGLLVLAVFAGNLVMKPFTSAILYRFRTTLVVNGLLNAATIFACALSLRLAELLLPQTGDGMQLADFHLAFIAIIALLAVLDSFTLGAEAGNEIRQKV